MSPSQLSDLAQKVLPLVQEAGGIAHACFCSQEFRIDTKTDGSPVTQADKETEECLRLAGFGNSWGVIGEEFGEEGRISRNNPVRSSARSTAKPDSRSSSWYESSRSSDVRPFEEVKKVAKRLRGKSLLLVGGDDRPYAEEALKSAFHLANLYRIGTRRGESVSTFEAPVARPDVVAVLLAIRWARHCYGDVSKFCTKHDKSLIRLPWGYNPKQVAARILEHCPDWVCDDDVGTGDNMGPTENADGRQD